jgi:hypothetical protein
MPRTKDRSLGADDDDSRCRVAGNTIQYRVQLGKQLAREGISLLGPIEDQPSDSTFAGELKTVPDVVCSQLRHRPPY